VLRIANYFNIFDTPSHFEIVVPVNCVGVAGAGLAKDIMSRHKILFTAYKEICNRGSFSPGDVVRVYFYNDIRPAWILFATKDHWRDKSKLEWIEKGFDMLSYIEESRYIALPAVGCGLGGLNWEDVKNLAIKYLGYLPSKEIILIKPKEY